VLELHRAERADALVAGLVGVLRAGATDPFAAEVVAVPARGVERWLAQQLSHHLGASGEGDGVCANVEFPWPSTLVATTLAAAIGLDPAVDPWRPERTVWAVLDVIDACVGEAWLAALGRHLDDGPGRRFVVARHVSRLFDTYASHRPAMLRAWLTGDDSDGLGSPLPGDLGWQPELWRRLCARVGTPSPAERLVAACAALRADASRVDLPPHLSVFGPTRLSTDQVAVLAALGAHRDVHLWLPHPSPVLWEAVAPLATTQHRRRTDPTAAAVRHPLLASLGRDARELQVMLATAQGPVRDQHHRLADPPGTLLGRLQHDLRADRPPAGVPLGDQVDQRAPLAPTDRSLVVHAAHGRARQVEVLREVLLGLLAADDTLEPRDVLVMCPDIESYAPLLSATFGLASGDEPDDAVVHPGHRLRVRLADRSLRQTNPLLATLSRLLVLADARVTAAQVLDLAALAPVRRRFRFDDQDLERLRGWVVDSGVRWGLDAAHRAPYSLEGIAQNTWQAGLDRILLGAAMAEDDLRWVGLALPLDDVDSSDVDRAGRLAELVDRLGTILDRLGIDQPVDDWLAALSDGLDELTAVAESDGWQLTQARRQLSEVAEAAGAWQTTMLSLADVRVLLADRLQGRPTRAGFRTGTLTVCSMVPMRSVPHRVVCLLGLDDGAFPRTSGVDGDDVLARDPLVGERDRRSEDRQLLLDAILAATEHLVIVHTGADERTNARRPPAVPVGEILDVVDQSVRTRDGRRAREHVVVRHPLQPFDPRNFSTDGLGVVGPFSFDTAALAGARAAVHGRGLAPTFLPAGPLPDGGGGTQVALDDLVYFLEHPVRAFLRRRLGVLVAEEEQDPLPESLPAQLEALQRWAIGDQWLQSRLDGVPASGCRDAEWRRGALPPGAIGRRVLAEVELEVEPLVRTVEPLLAHPPSVYDLSVPMPDGRVLVGTVGGVRGDRLVRAVYSRLGPKHRLRAWAQLLALTACHPGIVGSAVTLGRGRAGPVSSTLVPSDAESARLGLGVLADLLDRGLNEPLPLPVQAAEAYAQVRRTGDSDWGAREAARRRWTGSFDGDQDRYHARVWGSAAPLETLLMAPAQADEQPDGGNEPTRFGALACRLWYPLLAAETTDAR